MRVPRLMWTVIVFACAIGCNPLPQSSSTPPTDPPDGVVSPPRSARNANYTMTARLDPASRTIAGTASIAWKNLTTKPAAELQFHLYWNAWKNAQSTFFRELARSGSIAFDESMASHVAITGLTLTDRRGAAVDLMNGRRFIAPDDGNAQDETVMAVALPTPVAAGESATIEVQWTARVPGPIARSDVVGDVFFIAQWFPKLGVLEEAGWNCHQFHADTEFFADFGVYDVELTVPEGWIVGATGAERSRSNNGDGTTTHRYYQEDVHDFAWTTSPRYVEQRAAFEHDTLPRVNLRLLLLPDHADQAERHFAAARSALRRYGEWFGAYPYGHLTIVDPAYGSSSAGMEYPTLITAATAWLNTGAVTYFTPEEVVIHEVGHQWWYGMVATNEFEHAWMDEGFTTYTAARILEQDYPDTFLATRFFGGFIPWVFADLRVGRDTYWNRLSGYRRNAESDVPATASFRYSPGSGPFITYNKTTLWLHTLERMIGWPAMQQALQLLAQRHAFAHPRPEDFFKAVNDATGSDFTWFFDQVYRSSNTFDYGVEGMRSERRGDGYTTSVTVRRYGEGILPVDIAVTFADGERVVERWDGRDRWTTFTYTRPAAGASAQVDPERVLLLDVSYTNNSWSLQPRTGAAVTKWTLKWLSWAQGAMATWGFLL